MATCKHGEVGCGTHYYCGKCADERRRIAYKSLTPKQKAYDNTVDPLNAYHTDYDRESSGCSCHINPPCSYCTSKEQPKERTDGCRSKIERIR